MRPLSSGRTSGGRKEARAMFQNQVSIHAQHTLRTRQLRESARRERLFAPKPAPRRLRRVVGRSMVTIGDRLAAEPSHERARPR
jgi:hypothetical protein